MIPVTYVVTWSEAGRDILRFEAIDGAISEGPCTHHCEVVVDEIADGQTAIRHNGEPFVVAIAEHEISNYGRRQQKVIRPYVQWTRQFHPATEAWMT